MTRREFRVQTLFGNKKEKGNMAAQAAADRTLYFGSRVPEEFPKSLKLMIKSDKNELRRALEVALDLLKNGYADDGSEVNLGKLNLDDNNREVIGVLCGGMLFLLRTAIRLPTLKPTILRDDLLSLQIPQDFVADFVKVVEASRGQVGSLAFEHKLRMPTIEKMQWRVDVAISTSALSRVLKPNVTIQLTLSDGSIKSFEISTLLFHDLRYNVALVLKEMENLEQKNILKIKD